MDTKQIIKGLIQEALRVIFQVDSTPESIEVNKPDKRFHGDYSTNIALKLAKSIGIHSMELSMKIARQMETNTGLFKRIEVISPGFINFFLLDYYTYQALDYTLEDIYQLIGKEQVVELQNLIKANNSLKAHLSEDKIRMVQYMHSRIYSILNYFENEGICLPGVEEIPTEAYGGMLEKQLIIQIGSYPTVIGHVLQTMEPEELLKYLWEITDLFYQVHQGLQFRKLDKNRLLAVLKVLEGLRIVVHNMLELLDLDAPEKM